MNVVAGFSTGDVKVTIKIVADPGWLMMDDTNIGSAASGATNALDGTEQLFNLIFNHITDAWAPILTSTGTATDRTTQGSASAAWTANCRMTLPKALGRALAAAGSGSGLVNRVFGSTAGADTAALTEANMASHTHGVITHGGAAPIGALSTTPPWGHDGSYNALGTVFDAITSPNMVSEAFSIRDPSLFLNVMIKL